MISSACCSSEPSTGAGGPLLRLFFCAVAPRGFSSATTDPVFLARTAPDVMAEAEADVVRVEVVLPVELD